MINKYVTGQFKDDLRSTIGVAFLYKTIRMGDDIIRLQIWDFEGDERFRPYVPQYFSGSLGIIFCYSLVDRISYNNFFGWYDLITHYTDDIPIILVGTKLDLVTQPNRPLVDQRLHELKTTLGIEKTFLISSKDGTGIENTIHSIARDMWTFKNQYKLEKKANEKEYSLIDALRK